MRFLVFLLEFTEKPLQASTASVSISVLPPARAVRISE